MVSQCVMAASLAALLIAAGIGASASDSGKGDGLQINLRGDAAGHVIGVVVTPEHSAVADAQVSIRLLPESSGKAVTAQTDGDGVFEIDFRALSVGVRAKDLSVTARKGDRLGRLQIPVGDLALALGPQPSNAPAVKLTGEWRFAPDPPDGFWKPEFSDAAWGRIDVPSHWVMKGYDAKRWIGGYRRWVDVPASWKSQRLKLRFEGVHTGAEVWVNGSRVGYHDGGATPFEFDVTEAARSGARNLIAVRVAEDTESSNLDAMSMYAHFPLAGIYRDVSLYSVPRVHLARVYTEIEFDANRRNAKLRVVASVANESAETVRGAKIVVRLASPDGHPASAGKEITCDVGAWSASDHTITLDVAAPRLWDPEHPVLYNLTTSVVAGGESGHMVTKRIGFRDAQIKDSVFLLNGAPIKLRGACRHDAHPLMGRAITPGVARQDLELMKSCNMNGFRTSHYPPIHEVLDMASEMGFGVEDEAALCFVGADWGPRPGYSPPVTWVNGLNPTKDPWYIPIIIQQIAEMVERDRSQPCVLWWSMCNESSWGPAMEWAKRWLKRTDPTRYTTGGGMVQLDITMYHNPTLIKDIVDSKKFGTPVLGEEALAIYQGFDENDSQIDLDPGMRDRWVVPFIGVWDEVLRSPWYMGVFTWAWSDDVFLIPGYGAYGMEIGRYHLPPMEFERALYAMPDRGATGDPPWGVIDGWGRPRPEYWLHKKLLSPIKVDEKPVGIPGVDGVISFAIRNRFDFTNLKEIKSSWSIGSAHGVVECDVPPASEGTAIVRVPQGTPTAGKTLELRFEDKHGLLIDAYRLPIGPVAPTARTFPQGTAPELREERSNLGGLLSGLHAQIVGDDFQLMLIKHITGRLVRASVKGKPILVNWPTLHVLPNAYSFAPEYPSDRSWVADKVDVQRTEDAVEIVLEGKCEDFVGGYRIQIDGTGAIQTSYRFTYQGPNVDAREVGLRMTLPAWFDTLAWDRNAEWSVYPEDHIGRPIGTATAVAKTTGTFPPDHTWSLDNSPMGCNDFRSAKRSINSVSLTDVTGAGIRIESDGSQTARACVTRSGVELHILDYYGGTRTTLVPVVWEPSHGTGRALTKGDVVEGTVLVRLLGPSKKH